MGMAKHRPWAGKAMAVAMKANAAGTEVRLLATDPAVRPDLEAFCAATGHALVSFAEEQGTYVAVLRVVRATG